MPIFDPTELHDLIKSVVGLPLDEMFVQLHESLLERYPGHIDPSPEWILNQAGGSLGQFLTLHASLEEYILIFGTPVGTQGHSGRFPADDYYYILSGEQHVFHKGDLQMRVYEPGDLNHMRRGHALSFRMTPGSWGVEYARGFIPGMLPFGLADTVFSNLDYGEFLRLVRVYGRNTVRELAHKLPLSEGMRRALGVRPEARSQLREKLRLRSDDGAATSAVAEGAQREASRGAGGSISTPLHR